MTRGDVKISLALKQTQGADMSRLERIIFADPELFAAFQIGRHTHWRDDRLTKARTEKDAGTRALLIKWARDSHHEALKYMRQIP